MRNLLLILAGISFCILFFYSSYISIVIWILLFFYGVISFLMKHIKNQEKYPGDKWEMRWDKFLENLIGYELFFFVVLQWVRITNIWVHIGCLIFVIIYSSVMGLYKKTEKN